MKIVYESNTGHTKEYALMLASALNIPCVSLKEYKPDFEEIIFMSWVMAGMLKGYSKIKNKVKIICTIGVGLMPETNERIQALIKNNDVKKKFFYLPGGVNYKKLRCIKKRLLKAVGKQLEKENLEENKEIVQIIKKGGSLVKKENLKDIINYIKENDV